MDNPDVPGYRARATVGEYQPRWARHYAPPVWALWRALEAASVRLPRGGAQQRFVEGCEKYVRLTGKGRPGPGGVSEESRQWWADVLAMVQVAAKVSDEGTRQLLAPWLRAEAPGGGFTPFGG